MRKAVLKGFWPCGVVLAASIATWSGAQGETPDAIAAPDKALVTIVHAEGAQVYECMPDAGGHHSWQYREPIATLLKDGETVGRHYAGPSWELNDGSAVTGKVIGRAPGAAPTDIPLLKLQVTSLSRGGQLSAVTVIQRLNTKGGVLEGACSSPGAIASAPYTADYAFLKDHR
ncbi:MAG: DUF3455 domain-containing protein [Xanthobacteraceae bacterium]